MRRENWPTAHASGSRGCAHCRDGEKRLIEQLSNATLSTALRHAQEGFDGGHAAEAPKPRRKPRSAAPASSRQSRQKPQPQTVTIPSFGVSFGPPVSIEKLNELKAQRKGNRPVATPPGWVQNDKGLYAYYVRGIPRPIYVGETRPTSKVTMLKRIYQEIAGKGADKSADFKKLFDLLNQRPVALFPGQRPKVVRPSDIFVRPGKIVTPSGYPIDFGTDPSHHGAELLLKGVLDPILGKGSLTFEDDADSEVEAELDFIAAREMQRVGRGKGVFA